jgi:acetyl esterase/lipase
VWNVEYRRLGNGGGWPMTFADVATGADFLRGIADQCALDLSHVVATGHSAGGHLALWLAGRHRLPAASPLFVATALPMHGVVSLAGIPDLAEGVKQHLARGMCQELVGGSPEAVPQAVSAGLAERVTALRGATMAHCGPRRSECPCGLRATVCRGRDPP